MMGLVYLQGETVESSHLLRLPTQRKGPVRTERRQPPAHREEPPSTRSPAPKEPNLPGP